MRGGVCQSQSQEQFFVPTEGKLILVSHASKGVTMTQIPFANWTSGFLGRGS